MKKYINICTAIAILFSTLSITSCGSKTEEVKQDEHQEGEHHEDESTVELTDEQAKTVGITLGKIDVRCSATKFSERFCTNGRLFKKH